MTQITGGWRRAKKKRMCKARNVPRIKCGILYTEYILQTYIYTNYVRYTLPVRQLGTHMYHSCTLPRWGPKRKGRFGELPAAPSRLGDGDSEIKICGKPFHSISVSS